MKSTKAKGNSLTMALVAIAIRFEGIKNFYLMKRFGLTKKQLKEMKPDLLFKNDIYHVKPEIEPISEVIPHEESDIHVSSNPSEDATIEGFSPHVEPYNPDSEILKEASTLPYGELVKYASMSPTFTKEIGQKYPKIIKELTVGSKPKR